MPEVRFEVEWPDGRAQSFYSPSLIVEEYFTAGSAYPVADFVSRSQEALGIASDRVQARYGFPCSLAAASLRDIETSARAYTSSSGGTVTVRGFRR